ncbi:MAG: protein kinase domain-containing protein [Pyrinomonadaceae bacterium]
MNPERWQQLERLYQAALERAAGERSAFLEQACAGDEQLRREVERLIASHESQDSFLQGAAFDLGMELLANEESELLAGEEVGPYRLFSFLGSGGMGQVYLARDMRLGRKVAVKLLPASVTANPERVQRFRQEARAASTISHPSVAHVYEVGEAEGRQYIAMEFVDGMTLRERLSQAGRLAPPEAISLAVQVAAALSAAHAVGILHRDIKPENIMLGRNGSVKVLDFGLAKLTTRQTPLNDHPSRQTVGGAQATNVVNTEPGLLLGTAQYMSPEQARGQDVDARADIWSLGVVLYEMLAGHTPFEGATNMDVLAAILKSEPQPLTQFYPGAPAGLLRFLDKALSKEKEERYLSGAHALAALRELQKETGPEARREPATRAESGDTQTNGASRKQDRRHSEKAGAAIPVAKLSALPTGAFRNISDRLRRPPLLLAMFAVAVALASSSVLLLNYIRKRAAPLDTSPAAVAATHRNVVSWWRGDEDANDSVGANRASLHNGASYADGKFGRALSFDGVDDYVEAPAVNLPTGNSPRTLELWFKVNAFDSVESFLAGYGNFTDAFGQTYQLGASGRDRNKPGHYLFFSSWENDLKDETPLQTSRWYHLAVTSDSNNFAKLYLDGELVSSGKVHFNTPAGTRIYIGRIPGKLGDTRRLNGMVDEVKVHNRELTPEEISLISRTAPPSPSPSEREAAAHFGLGYALEKQQKFAEAEAKYRQAAELNPNSALYHSGVGYTLGNQAKYAEAEIFYRTAVRLEPTSALYHAGLGWVLGEQGKLAEGASELRRAMQLDQDSGNTVYQRLLGRILDLQAANSRAK